MTDQPLPVIIQETREWLTALDEEYTRKGYTREQENRILNLLELISDNVPALLDAAEAKVAMDRSFAGHVYVTNEEYTDLCQASKDKDGILLSTWKAQRNAALAKLAEAKAQPVDAVETDWEGEVKRLRKIEAAVIANGAVGEVRAIAELQAELAASRAKESTEVIYDLDDMRKERDAALAKLASAKEERDNALNNQMELEEKLRNWRSLYLENGGVETSDQTREALAFGQGTVAATSRKVTLPQCYEFFADSGVYYTDHYMRKCALETKWEDDDQYYHAADVLLMLKAAGVAWEQP